MTGLTTRSTPKETIMVSVCLRDAQNLDCSPGDLENPALAAELQLLRLNVLDRDSGKSMFGEVAVPVSTLQPLVATPEGLQVWVAPPSNVDPILHENDADGAFFAAADRARTEKQLPRFFLVVVQSSGLAPLPLPQTRRALQCAHGVGGRGDGLEDDGGKADGEGQQRSAGAGAADASAVQSRAAGSGRFGVGVMYYNEPMSVPASSAGDASIVPNVTSSSEEDEDEDEENKIDAAVSGETGFAGVQTLAVPRLGGVGVGVTGKTCGVSSSSQQCSSVDASIGRSQATVEVEGQAPPGHSELALMFFSDPPAAAEGDEKAGASSSEHRHASVAQLPLEALQITLGEADVAEDPVAASAGVRFSAAERGQYLPQMTQDTAYNMEPEERFNTTMRSNRSAVSGRGGPVSGRKFVKEPSMRAEDGVNANDVDVQQLEFDSHSPGEKLKWLATVTTPRDLAMSPTDPSGQVRWRASVEIRRRGSDASPQEMVDAHMGDFARDADARFKQRFDNIDEEESILGYGALPSQDRGSTGRGRSTTSSYWDRYGGQDSHYYGVELEDRRSAFIEQLAKDAVFRPSAREQQSAAYWGDNYPTYGEAVAELGDGEVRFGRGASQTADRRSNGMEKQIKFSTVIGGKLNHAEGLDGGSAKDGAPGEEQKRVLTRSRSPSLNRMRWSTISSVDDIPWRRGNATRPRKKSSMGMGLEAEKLFARPPSATSDSAAPAESSMDHVDVLLASERSFRKPSLRPSSRSSGASSSATSKLRYFLPEEQMLARERGFQQLLEASVQDLIAQGVSPESAERIAGKLRKEYEDFGRRATSALVRQEEYLMKQLNDKDTLLADCLQGAEAVLAEQLEKATLHVDDGDGGALMDDDQQRDVERELPAEASAHRKSEFEAAAIQQLKKYLGTGTASGAVNIAPEAGATSTRGPNLVHDTLIQLLLRGLVHAGNVVPKRARGDAFRKAIIRMVMTTRRFLALRVAYSAWASALPQSSARERLASEAFADVSLKTVPVSPSQKMHQVAFVAGQGEVEEMVPDEAARLTRGVFRASDGRRTSVEEGGESDRPPSEVVSSTSGRRVKKHKRSRAMRPSEGRRGTTLPDADAGTQEYRPPSEAENESRSEQAAAGSASAERDEFAKRLDAVRSGRVQGRSRVDVHLPQDERNETAASQRDEQQRPDSASSKKSREDLERATSAVIGYYAAGALAAAATVTDSGAQQNSASRGASPGRRTKPKAQAASEKKAAKKLKAAAKKAAGGSPKAKAKARGTGESQTSTASASEAASKAQSAAVSKAQSTAVSKAQSTSVSKATAKGAALFKAAVRNVTASIGKAKAKASVKSADMAIVKANRKASPRAKPKAKGVVAARYTSPPQSQAEDETSYGDALTAAGSSAAGTVPARQADTKNDVARSDLTFTVAELAAMRNALQTLIELREIVDAEASAEDVRKSKSQSLDVGPLLSRISGSTAATSLSTTELEIIKAAFIEIEQLRELAIEQAHSGPIWRVDWGHPEYGNLIASCGEDRAVSVWSERMTTGGSSSSGASWKKRAQLLDATKAVVDVKFAPRYHGLKLAAGCLDGQVRVYEAPDILNMGEWLLEDYMLARGEGVQALSWSPDTNAEYIACVATDGNLYIHTKAMRKWQQLHCERHHPEPGSAKDVAFSPNLCRSYDLLVTCGREAKLWRFDTLSAVTTAGMAIAAPATKLTVVRVLTAAASTMEPGPGAGSEILEEMIWRASWNNTGSMITLAPESGRISVWTINQRGEWTNAYHIAHTDDAVSIKQAGLQEAATGVSSGLLGTAFGGAAAA
eukprot:g11197.t1